MKPLQIPIKLQMDLAQAPWFAHKEQLKLSSDIKLQKISNNFFSLKIEHNLKTIEYRFPWNDSQGFLWQELEWLRDLALESPIFKEHLDQPLELLTQSTHPCLIMGKFFVKFLPQLHSNGAQREIKFSNLFNPQSQAQLCQTQIHYMGERIALGYDCIQNGINAWDWMAQASRTQILDLATQLMQQIIELFAPSRQSTQITQASPLLQDLLGEPKEFEVQPSLAHMDCHLGQWMHSPLENRWKLIDFGACPMENPWWNGPECLEMDLAGLLRSVDYRLRTQGNPGLEPSEYLHILRSLPHCHAPLIAAAIVARNAYECAYELKHRPTWHNIPKQGLPRSIQLWQMLQNT